MSLLLYRAAIKRAAFANGLSPELVSAFVMTESSGRTEVTKFEPHFQWFFEPEETAAKLGISSFQERRDQATSWGLMQVMGALAREYGYSGAMKDLCLPDNGLAYGCKHVAHLIEKYGTVERAAAAYNAGSPRDANHDGRFDNQAYVSRVMHYFETFKGAPR